MTTPVLELAGVSKDYRGLRPLRIQRFAVQPYERLAIVGLDHVMAEVFVNLVTGTTLPDSGEVKIFGRATSTIADSAEWLTVVDRFGIVSDRAVLLDSFSVLQNLAIPFTLDVEPPSDAIAARAADLAREVGLPESDWAQPVAALDGAGRVRVRLGRALALDPAVVLLEHPTAGVDAPAVGELADCLRTIAGRRRAAVVLVTADPRFASAVAERVLTLDAATGRLDEPRRRWFGLRSG